MKMSKPFDHLRGLISCLCLLYFPGAEDSFKEVVVRNSRSEKLEI